MPCPNCHADVPPGAEFCTHCGTPLDSQAPDTEGHQPPIPEQGANQTAPSYPLPPPYVPYGGSPYAPPYADQPYTDSPYAPPSQPYAPPSQPYAPPSQPYSNLYSQPLPGATYSQPLPTTPRPPFMPDLFGANVAPAFAVPRTRAQALLLRYFPSRLGVSLWFTAALGAVVAAITGLILSFLVQLVWENLIKTTLAASSPSVSSFLLGSLDTSSLGLDPLKIFALAHHVPLVMTYSGNVLGASASGSGSLDLPLTGLLLVPALALTLGGYLSASSDYSHVARYSIARGALIAPFYGLITFFLAVVATSHLSGAAAGVSSVASIGSSPAHALVYGLLWGVLFGALGGWIQVSGRHWLAAALPTLQAVRNPRAAGAVAGAVIALVSGILIFLVLGFAALAFFNVHAAGMAAPVSTATTPQIGAGTAIGILLETMSIFGPTAAIWLFALATGAALNAFESITSTGLGPGGQRQVAGSLGFIGAQQTLTPSTLLLLGLVPLVCYLIGGRVAARIARAPDVRAAAVAGALMAVPLSLLMAALAAAVSVGLRVSAFGQTISEGAGPSVGGTFLAVLLFGALGGALGGASTQRAPWLGELARLPLAVLSPLARPLFAGLDRLTARPRDAALTPARAWLYDGVLALVALGTVAIALAILSVATAPVVASFRLTTMVDQWVVALLVAVPPLYFIGALIAAFSAPPPVPAFAAPSPLGMPPGPSLAFGVPITVPPPMPPSGAFGTMPPMPPPSGTELER